MAKDPAFLFYPNDYLGGTMGMTFEAKGAYMDILIAQFNFGHLSEKKIQSILRGCSEDVWNTDLKDKFKVDMEGLYYNPRLDIEKNKRHNFVESRRQSRLKSDEDSVRLYIVRDNVRLTYKIGSSVNPVRRYNALSNQESPAIISGTPGERNLTLIWYSDIVRRSAEKEVHNQYDNKRIIGEWFALDESDIDKIVEDYKGTYVERTEDENENQSLLSIKEEESLKSPPDGDTPPPKIAVLTKPKVDDFYREQIKLSDNDPTYKKTVEFLLGLLPDSSRCDNILGLKEQLTFEQFKKVKDVVARSGTSISELLIGMENKKDLQKKYKSVNLTMQGWARLEGKRSNNFKQKADAQRY